jgi:hypothetical protein
MKKLFMILGLLLIPMVVFCQQDSTIVTPDGNIWDFILNFKSWIASFPGVVVATTLLASILNGFLKISKKFVKQLIAWGIAIVLLVGTDLLNLGYAKYFPIVLAVIHGLVAGLAANGFFDVPFLKALLDKVEVFFTPKK